MTKLNTTSELFSTSGFRKPNVQKIYLKILIKQLHKLYECTWVVTTGFCSINLVEGEANETPRDAIFIHDPFHEVLY